jgi:hypothetical protein
VAILRLGTQRPARAPQSISNARTDASRKNVVLPSKMKKNEVQAAKQHLDLDPQIGLTVESL